MSDKSYWAILVWNWCKVKNRSGLTIPYLVGAPSVTNEQLKISVEDIKEFIASLLSGCAQFIPVLFWCDDIRQYVIGISEPDFEEQYWTIKDEEGKIVLYYREDVNKFGSSKEEIFKGVLNIKAIEAVNENNFSWDGKNLQWKPYESDEIEFIKGVL